MAFFRYASFPNSRNKSRSPTVNATTFHVAVSFTGQPLTLVSPANLNRTYILLNNTSETLNMRYLYATTAITNPMSVARFGVTFDLLYNPDTATLYQKQDDGLNTNWVVVQPIDVSEEVLPLQNANLESLQDIYAFSDDGATGLTIFVDEGRG
jgi:hypothetical protein